MAGIFVEGIIDIVLEVAAEEAAEIAAEVEAEQQAIEEQAVAAYEAAEEVEAAEEAAVTSVYNNLTAIDVDFADEAAYQIEEETGVSPSQEDPGDPGNKYDDDSVDKDPNKANIQEDSDQWDKYCSGEVTGVTLVGVPEGDSCANAKAQNTNKYLNWAKENWSKILYGAGITAATVFVAIGAVSEAICKDSNRSICTADASGVCSAECQKYNCNVTAYCEPQGCSNMTNTVTTIRKYLWVIAIVFVILALIFVFYFKSVETVILLGAIFGFLWLLTTGFGNLVSTVYCNLDASACVFSTGKPNC